MLNSKQRAALRAMANPLDTVFQIGKGGITEETCKQIANGLEANELMKIRVLETSGYAPKDAANEVAEKIGADVVAVVGTRFVLYKESVNKKKIILP